MKYLLAIIPALLVGCSTPVTALHNPTTKHTATCGGGSAGAILGGAIGYSIQKAEDDKCIADLKARGYN